MYKINGIVILEDNMPINDPHFDLLEPFEIDYTLNVANIRVGYFAGPDETMPYAERSYEIDISEKPSWSKADFIRAMLNRQVHKKWKNV